MVKAQGAAPRSTPRTSLSKGAIVNTPTAAFDQMRFRETLGHFPTGVVVVTAIIPSGEPVGMVVGSFTSVSLDPPLVAFLPAKSSGSYAKLSLTDRFCVNVLSAEQEDVCRHFASRTSDKFASVPWMPAPSGAPIIDGAVAWIDCSTWAIHEGGDHYIVLGKVEALDVVNPTTPLLFFQGGYGRFTNRTLMAAGADLIEAVQAAAVGRQALQDLADELDVECNVIVAIGDELVYVASTSGPSKVARATLGTRFPMMAPLGELHAARRGPEAERRWLERAGDVDEETRAGWQERLEMARSRGWSMSLKGQRPEGELQEALRIYSSHTLTPAVEREVRDRIVRMSRYYRPVEIVPDQMYDLHSLVVSVPGEKDGPELAIRIAQLPVEVSGETVYRWLDRARRAAEEMAEAARTC